MGAQQAGMLGIIMQFIKEFPYEQVHWITDLADYAALIRPTFTGSNMEAEPLTRHMSKFQTGDYWLTPGITSLLDELIIISFHPDLLPVQAE